MTVLLVCSTSLQAEERSWAQEKCARYDKAFHELLDLVGRDGITEHFVSGNEAFIAAGCSNGADVCMSRKITSIVVESCLTTID